MIRPDYIPPSLLVEGLFCKKRLWLKAHNVLIFEENQQLAFAGSLKKHLENQEADDSGWMYEARLPSGSRLDAWIPQEALGIEFKSGRPHTTHLYQVWALRQELDQFNVKDAELQLWYRSKFKKEAVRLAEFYHLDHGAIDFDIYAICTESDDPDFLVKLERSASILIGELEQTDIPETKDPGSAVCHTCSYYDWCHVTEYDCAAPPVKTEINENKNGGLIASNSS